jgi:transposase-like protein
MLTKTKFLDLHRRQQESGLTIKEFCSNEAIAPATFYYWKKKLRQNGNSHPDFIPLVVTPSPTFPGQHHANQSSVPQSGEADALLELVYPNGTRLRVKKDLDLAQLRSLICLFD